MARRVPPASVGAGVLSPNKTVGLLAQDPALADWMREHLALVHVRASADFDGPVLLAVHAHAAALPQSLTWAYARLKRMAQQDATLQPERRLLPRLHLVLAGVQGAAQGQQALANVSAAVQQHLGVRLPPGAWLCSAPAALAPDKGLLALDFCRLAAELQPLRRRLAA